jgi:beta-N-acetylhexosaminidase
MVLKTIMRLLYLFLLTLVVLLNCSGRSVNINNEIMFEEAAIAVVDPLRLRAEEIVSLMDDRLLAAQTLVTGIDGNASLPAYMIELLTELPAGGVMLFRYNLNTDNDTIRNFLSEISMLIYDSCDLLPFIAADHEGGTVNRFQRGVATLPAASFYWEFFLEQGKDLTLARIETDSFNAGGQIFDLGVNMNFAPVAEHLIDENRSFLERRSYGPDPDFTALAATAFLQGMHRAGVLCVVKHFPGSAGPDPHYSPSVLYMDKNELDILVSPFAYLINMGARAIMAAHTAVPALDSEIASLSHIVMQNWLREELGFDGIIVSDDFIMAAAGGISPENAAVKSIAAGSDMILVWPAHLRDTHDAILNALEKGELSRERLLDAAQRIIYEKLKMGLAY